MADCTLLLTHYCDENYPLMKQLKPFRFYDDVSLEKILKSAFTKLKSNYKQYYVNKAEASNGNARFLALINMRNPSKEDDDNAFEIYRTEMRLILLQDPVFVKDNFHELQTFIQEGWNGLSETQRLDFYERAVLSTEDDEQHNANVDSSLVTRESIHYEHDDMFLTNEIDNYAFDDYVDAKRDQNCLLDTNTLWKQWKNIPDSEREIYYCNGYFTSLPTAKKLFIKEKETIKFDPERTAEQKQLSKAWNDLAGTIQDAYVMRAFKKKIQRHQNHKMLFIRKFNNNRPTSAATYTDTDSHLEFLHPFTSIHNDSEESAFIVYMEKMRPDMLKQPGMAQKRYWEVSLTLKDQWNALSKEKQQSYFDTVRRYLEIRRNLYAWKLEAKEVYGQGDAAFQKLDAETKKKFEDIALQNRKVLLKMYPDLQDYARWIKKCYYKTDSKAAASSETKKTDTVESDEQIIT